jgi:hypothetical protein
MFILYITLNLKILVLNNIKNSKNIILLNLIHIA